MERGEIETFTGWALQDSFGNFFNPKNGKFYKKISITSHIYFDYDNALKISQGYNLTLKEVVITVGMK